MRQNYSFGFAIVYFDVAHHPSALNEVVSGNFPRDL